MHKRCKRKHRTCASRHVQRECVAILRRLAVQQQRLEDVGVHVEAEAGVQLRDGGLEALDARGELGGGRGGLGGRVCSWMDDDIILVNDVLSHQH